MHDELRDALRRVEPPAGFAERVLRRAAEQPAPPSRPPVVSATQAVSRWAIAATVVAAIGGSLWYRADERRKQEGEEARRQVLLSLSIAANKLQSIEMKVNRRER